MTLQPGEIRTLEVVFMPDTLGEKSAQLQVGSSDLLSPEVTVLLSGLGIPPPTPTDTPTEVPSPTPTDTATEGPTPTHTESPSTTPTEDLSSTATETSTPDPSFSGTPTPTPTRNYDIHPNPVDGIVNAGDLLEWLVSPELETDGSRLLFEFAQHWRETEDSQ
jgi:hypothetical protein